MKRLALSSLFFLSAVLLSPQAAPQAPGKEDLPLIEFVSATSGVAEEEGVIAIPLRLSSSSRKVVTAHLEVSGGTASEDDYELREQSIVFAPGAMESRLEIRVNSNNGAEPSESIEIRLGRVENAIPGPLRRHRVVICSRDYRRLGGAFYFRYPSGERWEKYARVGPHADAMIQLKPGDDRLVFWRGSSYLPFLDTASGKRFADVMVSQKGDGPGLQFDSMNKHSHVRILESSPARVKVLWRYVPDLQKSDPQWWTEEYFTIYPDGSCFRKILEGTETPEEYRDPSHPRLHNLLLTNLGISTMPRTWIRPTRFRPDPVTLQSYSNVGYDRFDGSYTLSARQGGVRGNIQLRVEAETVNPALVVRGWGDAGVRIEVNGGPFEEFALGYNRRMENDDLVLWLGRSFQPGSEILIEPVGGSAPVVRRPTRDPYQSKVPLLPEGSPDPGPFGAYYTTLRYWDEWDHPWRVGEYADVVVQFDRTADRLVFWRGTTYVPHWVNERNFWYENEFCERRGRDSGLDGLCEPMQDHESRFSQVRIVHSSPARALVHWRYAPTTLDHQFFGVDETGWGDWVDDYYYVYPDETSVRDTTLYTSKPNVFNEWHEAIPLVNPGMIPEDVLEPETLAMANAAGRVRIYDFSDGFPPDEEFEDGLNILLVRIKGKGKPFAIAESAGQWFDPISRPGDTRYNHYDDWPAWPLKYRRSDWDRDPENGYREFWKLLPSHSSLMHLDWDNYESDLDGPVIYLRKILLNGMTHDDDVEKLIPLARFWENAPVAEVSGYGFSPAVYEKSQKAYILTRRISWVEELINRDDDRMVNKDADRVSLRLLASPQSPLVNPSFVINNWPEDRRARLFVNGDEVHAGTRFRQGIERSWDQWEPASRLVVWLECRYDHPVTLTLEMEDQ